MGLCGAIVVAVAFLGLVMAPALVAHAYTPLNKVTPKTLVGVNKIGDVEEVVKQVVLVLQVILFSIAGIFIVIAGYSYLTAQGDADKTANARNMILYAIIAVGIGLLATFLSILVQNLLKSK